MKPLSLLSFLSFLIFLSTIVAASAHGAPRISPADFKYIAGRTPSIFDNYYEFSRTYEARKPRFFVHVEPVFGPQFVMPTDKGDLDGGLSYVKLTVGSVMYGWDDGGVSLRFDMQSLGLGMHKGTYFADKTIGWSYDHQLWTLSGFHKEWRVTAGVYSSGRPLVTTVDDQVVFTGTEGYEVGNDHFSATESARIGAFVDLSLPYLDVAMVIDGDGLDRLKAANRWRIFEFMDSFGPYFASFPKVDNYQLGLYGDDIEILGRYLVVSAETAMRYEKGEGVAFNHAVLKVSTTLFVDKPDRETSYRKYKWDFGNLLASLDFHLRLEAHGSYFHTPSAEHGFGGGGMVEFLSFGVLGIEGNLSIGVNWNYYDDIIELPVTDVFTGRLRFVLGF